MNSEIKSGGEALGSFGSTAPKRLLNCYKNGHKTVLLEFVIVTYLLSWHYNPLRVLAFCNMLLQPGLFSANVSQLVTPIVLKLAKAASHHLDFGRPALLLPSGLVFNNFLGTRFSSIRCT